MLNGLLNVGQSALNAAQAWISVTGSNIANADTEGYTRRYVDQKDAGTITANPGGEGIGVNAQQILRYFSSFLESSYVQQSTNSSRWSEQETVMSSVESIFNESNRSGVSSAINAFFTAWQDLTQRPGDTATRESLLSYADSLCDMMIQFTSSGTLGTDALNYRWSKDGGTTWTNSTVAAGSKSLVADGVTVTMA